MTSSPHRVVAIIATIIMIIAFTDAKRCPAGELACGADLCYDPKTQRCGNGGNATCASGSHSPDIICNKSESSSGSYCDPGRIQVCTAQSKCCPSGQRGCGCSGNKACYDPNTEACVSSGYGPNHAVCAKGLKGCGGECYDSKDQKCNNWCNNPEGACRLKVCGIKEQVCGKYYEAFCCPDGSSCAGDGSDYGKCIPKGFQPCPNSGIVEWMCPSNKTCGHYMDTCV